MAGSLIVGAAGKFGLARGAHAGQRGGLVAGHQLDLAGSLVQEQVEAADDDGTGLGGDLGEGGGPGGVHHVEHGRGTGAGIPGPFGVKVGGTGRHGGNEQVTVPDLGAERPQVHLHAQPARGSQQVAGPGPVTDEDRRGLQAGIAEGGEGGAGGRARAEDGGAGRRGHAGFGQGRDHAGNVGVVAVPLAAREHHRVGPARLDGDRLGAVEQRQHRPLQRHGQRQPGPLTVAGGDQGGQPGLVALDRRIAPVGQAERGVRGRVQHRRQGVLDRRSEHRGPAGVGHGQPFARLCASSCRNCWNWAGLEV